MLWKMKVKPQASSIHNFMHQKIMLLSILSFISLIIGPIAGVNSAATVPDDSSSVIECSEERECKAACGSSTSDYRCNPAPRICVCLNEFGPSRRCRNVRHEEEQCTAHCKRKIAQICYTDFGKFCTCFVRN